MISSEQTYQRLAESVRPLPPVNVALAHAVGRILTQDLRADVDSPPHRKSVMDGFAVRSSDINAGQRKLKIVETVVAGGWPTRDVNQGEATRIMTGAPLPVGADAVVMVELTKSSEAAPDSVEVTLDSIVPGQHSMNRAENFATGDIIFTAGHRIRPADIGLLAEVGAHQVRVGGLPSIAILPTGDELVACDQTPLQGTIRNSNGPMLAALARELGLAVTELPIGRDCPEDLQPKMEHGLQHDVLLLSGGVSAGLLDLVPRLLKNAGVVEVFHKVAIKPGKPIWFGVFNQDGRRRYVFGLPGNPVSSLVGFHLFVRTAIRQLESDPHRLPISVAARLASPHETRGDRPTYWPGRQVTDDSISRSVEPLVWKGSSDLLALGSADGFIFFPGEGKTHESGTEVRFFPLSS